MKRSMTLAAALLAIIGAAGVWGAEHPGKTQIEKEGYKGPATCEACHPGKAREFLDTVHWKHASTWKTWIRSRNTA